MKVFFLISFMVSAVLLKTPSAHGAGTELVELPKGHFTFNGSGNAATNSKERH
jgi:hypothetical protein